MQLPYDQKSDNIEKYQRLKERILHVQEVVTHLSWPGQDFLVTQ